MCGICATNFSRRAALSALAGAAGLGLTSRGARAAGAPIQALVVTCMDYRVVDETTHWFDAKGMTNNYDLVALAGATLAATSPKFPNSNAAFWDHVGFAKQLHHISKVVMVDHFDCGAYRLAAGATENMARDPEIALHKAEMVKLKAALKQRHPDLGSEFYMINLDGKVETIAV